MYEWLKEKSSAVTFSVQHLRFSSFSVFSYKLNYSVFIQLFSINWQWMFKENLKIARREPARHDPLFQASFLIWPLHVWGMGAIRPPPSCWTFCPIQKNLKGTHTWNSCLFPTFCFITSQRTFMVIKIARSN